MGFLGIGAMEAMAILVIALIIFGPGRLPEMMGEAGRAVRDFRRATRELTGDFQDSISEVRGTYEELERDMRSTAKELKRDTENIAKEVNSTVAEAGKLDSKPRQTARRRPTAQPLDQVDSSSGSESDEEDLSQYFPASDQVDDAPASKPKAASVPKPTSTPKRARATVPAAGSNGASQSDDDLLATEDVDDLLSIDE
jgi:TatA/E family protein of Tat protein translocase